MMHHAIEYACFKNNISKISQCLENKQIPTFCNFYYVLKHFTNGVHKNQVINMFVDYGYYLTYVYFLKTIKHHVIIKSINKFNFNYDDEFYYLC